MIKGHYVLWLIACLRISTGAELMSSSNPSAGTKQGWGAAFEAALQHAEKRDAQFGKLVLMATVQEQMARQHLPILLASLHQAADLGKHLLVVALDEPAYKVCQKVHDSRLCVQLEVEDTINGKHMNATIDEHGHSSSKWLVGWMKTKLLQRAVLAGYACLFLDVDQVMFKDPFSQIKPEVDVAVTNDCVWYKGYHPKWEKKEWAMPNLGLTWFRPTSNGKAVLEDWLGRAAPDTWDQWQLKLSLEHMCEVNPQLYVQMLSEEFFPTFCCDYCSRWVDAVVGRYKGFADMCPQWQRQRFVAFHVACIKSDKNHGYDQDAHDETLEKRDAMLAVWEAVNGTSGFLLASNLRMQSL